MLHFEEETIRQKLFDGLIGLEKEGLRVTEDGFLAQTPHPFSPDDPNIVRDFCENQTEINTAPRSSVHEAYEELLKHTLRIKDTLKAKKDREYRIYNQNVPVPNGRYRMLFHHLHSYVKYRTLPMYFHPHPEFGTFSSASQVQLDVNYEDIPEAINTFSLLEPIKALIFSNSVLLGEAEDYLCYRDILWENSTHGINPHNVGPYEYIFKNTDELLDYIQSTSIYCTEREGRYVNFRPLPLRDYFAQDEIEGADYVRICEAGRQRNRASDRFCQI